MPRSTCRGEHVEHTCALAVDNVLNTCRTRARRTASRESPAAIGRSGGTAAQAFASQSLHRGRQLTHKPHPIMPATRDAHRCVASRELPSAFFNETVAETLAVRTVRLQCTSEDSGRQLALMAHQVVDQHSNRFGVACCAHAYCAQQQAITRKRNCRPIHTRGLVASVAHNTVITPCMTCT